MPGIHVEGLSQATPEVYLTCLQAGDYDVTVQSVEPVTSSKGSQGIKFELLVEEGPMQVVRGRNGAQNEYSPIGRHIFTTLWLPTSSQKDGGAFAAGRLAKVCEVCDVAQSDDLELNDFIGKRCKVRNKPSEGQDGVERDDIVKWFPL